MDDVFENLKTLSERYTRLHKHFVDFYQLGTPLLKGGKIRGVEIGQLKEQRYFDVSLAGTTVRFVFTFPASADSIKGRVTCYWVDPLRPDVLKAVGHFDFNGEGDSGRKFSTDRGRGESDPALMGTDFHACWLQAELLHTAIIFTPPG
jgi:hypothetical protein